MKCIYCKRDTIRSILAGRCNNPLLRTWDHVVPLSRGGANARENKVIACLRCNNIKGDMMPEEWAAYMASNPLWWSLTRRQRREGAKSVGPLPIEETRMILTYGKKAWKAYRDDFTKPAPDVCPVMAMVADLFVEARYPHLRRWRSASRS